MIGGGIKRLADFLSENERKLAAHIAGLFDAPEHDAVSLMTKILPGCWITRDCSEFTIAPRDVYRALHYLHVSSRQAKSYGLDTRKWIWLTGQHLEGCLEYLTTNVPGIKKSLNRPFGPLVKGLEKEGVLPFPLAKQLLAFNSLANVPAKHITASPTVYELNKTFSVLDAATAFVVMRKLSIQLFEILRQRGITLPKRWIEFSNDWLL